MTMQVRSCSAEQAAAAAPEAAVLLIASRALLDAADVIDHMAATAPVDDYAGRDVLCGLGALPPDDADEVTRLILQAVLHDVTARLREQADHDWEQAVASIGAAVRATRPSLRHVQHRPARHAA